MTWTPPRLLPPACLCAALAMSACSSGSEASVPALTRPLAASSPVLATDETPQLRLLAVSARTGAIGNFWFIDGEVRNVGAVSYDRVEAVVRVFNQSGASAGEDSALLDRALLEPGAVGRFSVVTRDQPELASFDLMFRTAQQGLLRVDDSDRRSLPYSGHALREDSRDAVQAH